MSPAENVLGKSVAIACATISTARAPSPRSRTKRSLATTAAAAPLDVGHACSNVSGGYSAGDAITSSRLNSFWNCARGLWTECLWFFTAMRANDSARVP
jgi:hypothetical protein